MTSTSLDFLLIGKRGVGKTATCNSILNKFESKISSGPIKPVAKSMETEEGTKVSAIDGLNVVEVREAADFTEVVNVLADVDGISAFLIIVKFGERFTEADWDVILATKAVFGEDALSRFGICVFTNGDMFKRIVESESEQFQTIEEWLDEESGKMREVYEACHRRVVLFDNKTKVEKAKQEQRDKLFQQVALMEKDSTSKYTLKKFEDFDGKEKLIQRKRQKDMVADTQEKINEFRHRFIEMSKGGVDRQVLIALEKELKNLKQDLEKEFSAESDITVPVRALLFEVQAVIGFGNTKSKSTPQKKYDNEQPDVNTASQNEESIATQPSKQLLSEKEEEEPNLIKTNEEVEKKDQAAFELKTEIESNVKKMTTGFSDLQSKSKEAREQAAIGCANTKSKSTPQKKYDNEQPDVNTASQNEESIATQPSKQLLSEKGEEEPNLIKTNEEVEKKEPAAFELKKEIESNVNKMTNGISDLQSEVNEAGEQEKLLHEEALPDEKRMKTNPKSYQGLHVL